MYVIICVTYVYICINRYRTSDVDKQPKCHVHRYQNKDFKTSLLFPKPSDICIMVQCQGACWHPLLLRPRLSGQKGKTTTANDGEKHAADQRFDLGTAGKDGKAQKGSVR